MKKLYRILLAAAGGIIILALVWPVIDYEFYFTDALGAVMGVLTFLLAAAGALLLSYAVHEIHPAAVPLLWSAFFFINLAAVLGGNSDGFMADLAVVIILGIPGVILLFIGLNMWHKAMAPMIIGLGFYALLLYAITPPGISMIARTILIIVLGVPATALVVTAINKIRKSRRESA